MDDVREDILGPPHGTKPDTVIAKKNTKNRDPLREGDGDGSCHGFGYLSLFSDPIDLATWSQRELL